MLEDLLGFSPQWLLLALGPLFGLTMLAEFIALRRRSDLPSACYTWTDTISNAALAALYQVGEAATITAVAVIYGALFNFRLFEIPLTPWTLLLLLLLQDFCYYFFHLAHHRIRWCWCSHVVHHSSERLNYSTAFRQSLTYPLSGMWVFWIPLVIVGFPPEAVLLSVSISLAYQFFIHSQLVPKLGPLEWVLNTPSHHRAHHGRNARYIDRNYGGILIIWDRLFGTFVEESEAEPPAFGIPDPIHSHNPLTLTFHEWKRMFRDAGRPGLSLRQRLAVLLSPPAGPESRS
ncbi:MAG: sterol desaturase [Alteromonadaceae bacterium]|nr:sterol desaturase [Alteromonadaceae bacterium]